MFFVPDYNFYHFFNILGIDEKEKTTDPYNSKHLVFHDTFIYSSEMRDNLFKIIEQRKKQRFSSEIVYEYSYEGGIGDTNLKEYLQFLKSKNFPIEDVKFIFNLSQKDLGVKIGEPSLNIHSLDMFSVSVLRHIQAGINQFTSKPLVYRNACINFLTAQFFHKKSRLKALHLLYQKGLIQNAITGILLTPEQLEKNKNQIDDINFYNWISNHLGPADKVNLWQDRYNEGHISCSGNPYSTHIYDQSRVSYVCETHCEVHAVPASFITEKTYRPIFNRSPFVLQGGLGQLDFLESIGIDTYRRYTGEYSRDVYDNNYVESVVDAARELLISTIKYPHSIDNTAEKNQNRIKDYAKHQLADVRAFLGATNEKMHSRRVRNPFK